MKRYLIDLYLPNGQLVSGGTHGKESLRQAVQRCREAVSDYRFLVVHDIRHDPETGDRAELVYWSV